MSKKLQLAFSERRIRKGIYRMYARFRPYHLIGAIGGFLTALTAIISLAVLHIVLHKRRMGHYCKHAAHWLQRVNRNLFLCAFSASRDSLIKVGSLIAGIGLGF